MIDRKPALAALASGTCALVLAAFSQPAAAAPRYYPNTYAGPTIQTYVYESTAGYHSFETENLQQYGSCYTPDTVMWVQAPDGQVAVNDDCNGSLASCVGIDSSESGDWHVVVFPYWTNGCGTADLVADGNTTILSNAVFAATVIDSGVPTGYSYTYETVETPSGAPDTVLYLFDSNWNLKGFDDDGGLGYESRFTANASSGDRIVLASYAPYEAGYTNFLINDCAGDPDAGGVHACDDADGDYLSDELEQEIGTNPNSRDTDGDGLYDYYEVYGRRLTFTPYDYVNQEPLVSEGADPLHRDVLTTKTR